VLTGLDQSWRSYSLKFSGQPKVKKREGREEEAVEVFIPQH
jgi:hypothetical protein